VKKKEDYSLPLPTSRAQNLDKQYIEGVYGVPQDTVVRKTQTMHALNVYPILGAESQPAQKMAP